MRATALAMAKATEVGEEFKVGQMPLTSGRPLQKREDRKKLKTTFSWLT